MTYDDAKETTLSTIPRDAYGNLILDEQQLEHVALCMHAAGYSEGVKETLLTITASKLHERVTA